MPSNTHAPGLRQRPRKGGETAYYWIAAAASRLAGNYPVKSVRLTQPTEEARAAACRRNTAELMEWIATNGAPSEITFRGSIASLIDCYQRDEDSPYRKLRENTQRSYDHDLKLLKAAVGNRDVAALTGKDFTRWHASFASPALDEKGNPVGERRVRRGHGLMTMLRMLFGYGVTMRFAGCSECSAILTEMRFEAPAKRRVTMAFDQASAIVEKAIERSRLSIALAQAFQFELAMRQIDVIGYWVKARPADSGIVALGKRWTGGLLWSDISSDLKVSKLTTKTGSEGEWDLNLAPLVVRVLALVPREHRIGPVVIDEGAGRPYLYRHFCDQWREIADAAKVPAEVWNRDSRSGGITEGSEAGADGRDLQRTATHSDPQTTERYIRRSLDATTRVARLRIARRAQSQNKT